MIALHANGTWELVPLPPGKSPVDCCWIYTMKVSLNGQVNQFKARLVAKRYIEIYGQDYSDTFYPIAKMLSVCLFLSMVVMCSWPLFQLNIKNAFPHGKLQEEIYRE